MLSRSNLPYFSIISSEGYIDKLKARVDVVREGLVSNPLDIELERTLSELRLEVTLLIFNKKWIHPLPTNNWLVVVNFILSLNDVSAAARKKNRSLYFSAQRSVFAILGYVFNHPDYSELFHTHSPADKELVFNVIQTMFGEAERQNDTPLLHGDMYAEGEWVSYIMGNTNFSLKYRPCVDGLSSAIDLWENLVLYSAKSNPARIPKLFENMKNSSTSYTNFYQRTPLAYPVTEKFRAWMKMYKNLKTPRLSTLKQHENAFKVLHGEETDGDFAIFNGSFGDDQTQFRANTLPKIEDIWLDCVQGSVFDSIAYMYGVCAFHDLWKELRECWYLSQPEDADASYCDHPLFTREHEAFSSWISNHIVSLNRTINARHELRIHMAAACTVLIGEMINTSSRPSFIFDTIAKSEELKPFIALLKNKSNIIVRESVMTAFGWKKTKAASIKSKVDEFLASELDRCNKHIADSLKNCIPNIEINPTDRNLGKGDRELVYEAWNQTNQNFWSFFPNLQAIKMSFSRKILSDIIEVSFKSTKSYYLCEKSGHRNYDIDFHGVHVAQSLLQRIVKDLKVMAKTPAAKITTNSTWFISEDDSKTMGLTRLKDQYGFDSHSHNYIKIHGNQSFVVEKDAAELILHEWTSFPWSSGENPVVISGFLEFYEFIKGVSSLYYEFKILNPSAIHLL